MLEDTGSFAAGGSARIFTERLLPLIQEKSGLEGKPASFVPSPELTIPVWNAVKDLDDKRQLKAFAKSHSDSAILLLGADEVEDVSAIAIDSWMENKIRQVNFTYWDEQKLAKVVCYPQEEAGSYGNGDDSVEARLRIVGQAWILVAEVRNWSAREWRKFALERYAQGGWVKFSWGAMGYIPATTNELPKFELLFEGNYQQAVQEFLYKRDLAAFLTAFLKISQFIQYRFQKTQPNLREHAARIERWRKKSLFDSPAAVADAAKNMSIIKNPDPGNSESVRLGILEKSVRLGNKILLGYSTSISDLAEYIHTVDVNSAVIEQVFSKHRGKISPFSAYHFWHREIALFRDQMNVEQKYHDIIYNHLRGHFEALKVIAEVKKSHFEYLLALIAIVFGAIVGFGQILASGIDIFWKNTIIVIIVILIGISLVLAFILSFQRFKDGDEFK
ncbi:MAG: hypothetical protein M3384_07760 [Acidobacteriota bacterium]|nr:hypothetical protein [Acidobacteriota bacterium]